MLNKICKYPKLLFLPQIIFQAVIQISGQISQRLLLKEPDWCGLLGLPSETWHLCCTLQRYAQTVSGKRDGEGEGVSKVISFQNDNCFYEVFQAKTVFLESSSFGSFFSFFLVQNMRCLSRVTSYRLKFSLNVASFSVNQATHAKTCPKVISQQR